MGHAIGLVLIVGRTCLPSIRHHALSPASRDTTAAKKHQPTGKFCLCTHIKTIFRGTFN